MRSLPKNPLPAVTRISAPAIDIDEQIPVRVCDNSTSPLAVARDQVNQAIQDLDSLYDKRRSELNVQLSGLTAKPPPCENTKKIGQDM